MADGPPIVIRIGASQDASIGKTFDSIEARANKANRALQKSSEKAGKLLAGGAEAAGKATDKLAAKQEAAAARAERAAQRVAAREAKEAEKAAAARIKASEKATAAALRGFEQIGRAARAAELAEARASQRSARRMGERFASGTANTATRFLTPYAPLASMARRTAGSLMRGAGIDLDPGAILGRAIDLNARATTLSANAFQDGVGGAAGVRQDPNALVRQSRSVAKKYGLDAGDVLGGLEKFTGVAGDLQTGRDVLDDMAKLSLTTGANLEDVVDASGQVAAILKDTPDKGQRVADVMRVMAGQGRLGAVELKDLSVQMAKIAATAGRIAGDPAENIKRLGALTQLARQRGGATGGAQAATAVARLADTVVTPARAAAFQKAGIDVIDKKSGLIRDLPSIIFDTVDKFGKDPIKLKKLFASSIGAKPAEALANVFRQGGDMRGEFGRILNADVKGSQNEDLARAMETPQAKIRRFQANLDELGDKLMVTLIPAFDRLSPRLLELGDIVARTTTWVADNPKTAIATAIGLSIGRAGIESTLRAGIERIMLGQGGGNAAALGKVAGSAGAAFAIGALAVTTLTVGTAIIDMWSTRQAKEQREGAESLAHSGEANEKIKRLAESGDVAGAKKLAEETSGANKTALGNLDESKSSAIGDWARKFLVGQLLGSGEGVFGVRKELGLTDKEMDAASASKAAAEEKSRQDLVREQRTTNRYLQQLVQLSGPEPGGPSGDGGGRASQL